MSDSSFYDSEEEEHKGCLDMFLQILFVLSPQYKFIERISGGVGCIVLRAQTVAGDDVAVKIQSEDGVEEIDILKKLVHVPHCQTLVESYCFDNGASTIVSELYRNDDILTHVKEDSEVTMHKSRKDHICP